MNEAFEDMPDYTIPDYSAAPSLPRRKKTAPPMTRKDVLEITNPIAKSHNQVVEAAEKNFAVTQEFITDMNAITGKLYKTVKALEQENDELGSTVAVLSSRLKATEETLLELIDKDDPPTTAV
ncbi:hypothetical protein Q4578_03960 [Shimia thalassica]|uniref:hypothetical protein n=1 Tax=Shimia thalassica TaxID=1715693 RepID=UPI0026E3F4A6|nr:hypothetical protein [Shimia thalassica]MDO6520724.1 hypothetical protein [Shimia thalassica]